MTDKNAIKYLKQLYPNGGHCWLDEQRIEAIGIAISVIEFKEKVRAEIERRMNELYNKLPDGNEVINGAVTIPDANITGKYTALESLLSFIDSMQLEEIPPKFPIISQKENPVCAFSTNRYTDEDRKILCEDCEEKCEYSKKEEPVSEELEEAMQHNAPDNIGIDDLLYWRNGFITGAKWGKNQAKVEIQAQSMALVHGCPKESITEDLENAAIKYAQDKYMPVQTSQAFKAGAKWQKAKDQSTIELAEEHAYFAGRTKTIEEIEEKLLSEVLPCFMHGGEADEAVAKLDEVLNQKK